MQGTAYEPLTLNIPLLGAPAGETSRDIEAEIEAVNSDKRSSPERRRSMTEDEGQQLAVKKRLRFAE